MKKVILTILLTFTLVLGMSVTCFAATSYDDVIEPIYDETQCDSCLIWRENNIMQCILYHSDSWRPYHTTGETIQWEKLKESPKVRYKSSTIFLSDYDPNGYNNGWGTMDQYDLTTTYFVDTIIISTNDILNEDGTIFFQAIPPLQKVMMTELPIFLTKVGGVMKILTACGVGCLALLTALKTLPRVLSIFQVR